MAVLTKNFMKITIELSDNEKSEILGSLTKIVSEHGTKAITNYFSDVSNKDFLSILRRALKMSSDNFFQQYMQYYAENKSPNILKKIKHDLVSEFAKYDDEKK